MNERDGGQGMLFLPMTEIIYPIVFGQIQGPHELPKFHTEYNARYR